MGGEGEEETVTMLTCGVACFFQNRIAPRKYIYALASIVFIHISSAVVGTLLRVTYRFYKNLLFPFPFFALSFLRHAGHTACPAAVLEKVNTLCRTLPHNAVKYRSWRWW